MENPINLRAIIISNSSGIPLFTLKFDKDINEVGLAGLIGAIKSLADNSFGANDEMYVNSGDQLIYCFRKNYDGLELIICALRNKLIENENLREPAEYTLDHFVQYYGIRFLKNWNGDVSVFSEFQEKLQAIVNEYMEKLKEMLRSSQKDQDKDQKKERGIMAILKKLFQ